MSIVMKHGFFNEKEAYAQDFDMFVHGCNAQGVMGAGVAKMVRSEFKFAYDAYMDVHAGGIGGLVVGDCIFAVDPETGFVVGNAITQLNYGTDRRQVNYEAVYRSLELVRDYAIRHDMRKIAMPMIGCGLAGGEWAIVHAMIQSIFGCIDDIEVTVYYVG